MLIEKAILPGILVFMNTPENGVFGSVHIDLPPKNVPMIEGKSLA